MPQTGSEMIVKRGCTNHDCSAPAGVGARYNPNIDNWTAMSSVNAPFPRQCHCGVDRSEMIIWGGCLVANAKSRPIQVGATIPAATLGGDQFLPRRSSEIHSFLSGRARRC